ncbi:MAG: hypothetical protein KGL39_11850 [Patescibacteria group bacterium]|nr:hypothetical protein [Patescibacteria group bacterium]
MTGKQSKVVKLVVARLEDQQWEAWHAYQDALDARAGASEAKSRYDGIRAALDRWALRPPHAGYVLQMSMLGETV